MLPVTLRGEGVGEITKELLELLCDDGCSAASAAITFDIPLQEPLARHT